MKDNRRKFLRVLGLGGAFLLPGVLGVQVAAAQDEERVVRITAKKFEFSPSTIELQRGVPVILELTSLDRRHGFLAPDFKIDQNIEPGTPVRVRVVPAEAGTFPFHCNVFCGGGHEDMTGTIVVS